MSSTTEKGKHTPGPWAISGPWDESLIPQSIRVCAPNYAPRQYVCDLYTGDTENGMDYHRRESLANARLIAAAPELLEALKAISVAATVGKLWQAIDTENPLTSNTVKAAITKAEGKA